jgi:hypothetical protein
VKPEPVGVAIEKPLRNLRQESGTIARQIGGRCAPVRHSRHGLDGHGHDFMTAHPGRRGDKPYTAGIVFTGCIEGGSRRGGGVSPVMLTGTGRVDPLPIGGHGVS